MRTNGLWPVSVVVLLGCAKAPPPQPPAAAVARAVRLLNLADAPAPAAQNLSRTNVAETQWSVTQILRLSPSAVIGEHHHPVHDETLFVHTGQLEVRLNGERREVRSGDVVIIPAGTTISGSNTGSEEAALVVVFSNTGRAGPLTVTGAPHD